MPSPLLHTATGLALYALDRPRLARVGWRPAALITLASVLPDVDVLAGLVIGDPNRFHGTVTHSLGFAVVVALVFGLMAGRAYRLRVMALSLVGCGLHAIMDSMGQDGRPPYGVPLLWPLVGDHFHATWPIFGGIHHGLNGASTGEFWDSIVSWANLRTLGGELLIGAALIFICAAIGRGLSRSPAGGTVNPHEHWSLRRKLEGRT